MSRRLAAENANDLIGDDQEVVLLEVAQRVLEVVALYVNVGVGEQVLVEDLLLERGDLALVAYELLERLDGLLAAAPLLAAVAGGEDADVDAARLGIDGRLLERLAMQTLRLLDVDHFDEVAEAELGVRLGQPDERVQLTRIGGDLALAAAQLAHLQIGLDERATALLGQLGLELGLGVHHVVLEHVHLERRAAVVAQALLARVIQRDEVSGESTVVQVVLRVEDEKDQVEARHERVRQLDVLHDRLLL